MDVYIIPVETANQIISKLENLAAGTFALIVTVFLGVVLTYIVRFILQRISMNPKVIETISFIMISACLILLVGEGTALYEEFDETMSEVQVTLDSCIDFNYIVPTYDLACVEKGG